MEIQNDEVGVTRQGKEKQSELVFIPSPGIGHLVSTVEIARLLIDRNDRFFITVLMMKLPFDPKYDSYAKSLTASTISDRIRFIDLPLNEDALDLNSKDIVNLYMETYKPHVRDAVLNLIQSKSSDSPQLAALFVDMFSTTMIDVAKEIGVPSYVVFTSGAGVLSLMFHLQKLRDEQGVDTTEFKDLNAELEIPGFVNRVPARVFPSVVFNKDAVSGFLNFPRRYSETKGIIINTYLELESHAINSLLDLVPVPLYPVGPILNLSSRGVGSGGANEKKEIMNWLHDQPPMSVLFICFGSMGSFGEDQVKEMAYALERSGHRFLWSLRRPPPKGVIGVPTEYENPKEILPEGFLDRTADLGMILGWAPQVDILAHPAIGGFMSHCGWNSILESLWFGVPIAAWPYVGEEQFNAFEMVIELGLAVDITLDYRKDFAADDSAITVSADVIEKGIRRVMENDSEVRKRVKKISEESRNTLMNEGSSYKSLGRLVKDLINSRP